MLEDAAEEEEEEEELDPTRAGLSRTRSEPFLRRYVASLLAHLSHRVQNQA